MRLAISYRREVQINQNLQKPSCSLYQISWTMESLFRSLKALSSLPKDHAKRVICALISSYFLSEGRTSEIYVRTDTEKSSNLASLRHQRVFEWVEHHRISRVRQWVKRDNARARCPLKLGRGVYHTEWAPFIGQTTYSTLIKIARQSEVEYTYEKRSKIPHKENTA